MKLKKEKTRRTAIILTFCSRCLAKIYSKEGYYIQINKRDYKTRDTGFLCEKCYKELDDFFSQKA